jgi:hypothetical protein
MSCLIAHCRIPFSFGVYVFTPFYLLAPVFRDLTLLYNIMPNFLYYQLGYFFNMDFLPLAGQLMAEWVLILAAYLPSISILGV